MILIAEVSELIVPIEFPFLYFETKDLEVILSEKAFLIG
jgi:hypothetical protein